MVKEAEMKVDCNTFRAFYSKYYDPKFDSIDGETLVFRYQSTVKLLDNSVIDLSKKFKNKDKYQYFVEKLTSLRSQYFSALCNRYMGVVFNSARRLFSTSISEPDMISYGEEILLKCVLNYKNDKHIKFITYFTNAIFNMSYTLVRSKHFKEWNKNVCSLNTLLDDEDEDIIQLPEERKFIPPRKCAPTWLRKSKIEEELNRWTIDPDMMETLKSKMNIKDDSFLNFLILKLKRKKSIISPQELDMLNSLTPIHKNTYKNFSRIYMYDSVSDDYKEKPLKNKIKEEILCQE